MDFALDLTGGEGVTALPRPLVGMARGNAGIVEDGVHCTRIAHTRLDYKLYPCGPSTYNILSITLLN